MKQKIAVEDWYPIWSHKPDFVSSILTPATDDSNECQSHVVSLRKCKVRYHYKTNQ